MSFFDQAVCMTYGLVLCITLGLAQFTTSGQVPSMTLGQVQCIILGLVPSRIFGQAPRVELYLLKSSVLIFFLKNSFLLMDRNLDPKAENNILPKWTNLVNGPNCILAKIVKNGHYGQNGLFKLIYALMSWACSMLYPCNAAFAITTDYKGQL